jgi:hypothetical protein
VLQPACSVVLRAHTLPRQSALLQYGCTLRPVKSPQTPANTAPPHLPPPTLVSQVWDASALPILLEPPTASQLHGSLTDALTSLQPVRSSHLRISNPSSDTQHIEPERSRGYRPPFQFLRHQIRSHGAAFAAAASAPSTIVLGGQASVPIPIHRRYSGSSPLPFPPYELHRYRHIAEHNGD